jgi:uncharacterized protein with HEPN domain
MSSAPQTWKHRLRHMQEAAARIFRYTAGMTQTDFQADEQVVDACVWNLTVFGEAARFIPEAVVQAYPEVPWAQIRGIRNRIVHGYDEIDLEIIWNVVRSELRPLVPLLERIEREAVE